MIKGLILKNSRPKNYSLIPLADDTQELQPKKSYKETWQRALKKLKNIRKLTEINNDFGNLVTQQRTRYNDLYLRNSQEVKISSPRFMVVPYGNFYIFWSLANLSCLIYISTIGIYSATFYTTSQMPSSWISAEFTIDLIFTVDLLLNFNLAYINQENKLITSYRDIWVNYLKSRLIFDIFTSFPTGFILQTIHSHDTPSFLLIRFVPKLFRWIGIKQKLKSLYFIKSFDKFMLLNKHFFELFIIFFSALILLHLMACLFFLSARLENFNPNSWVNKRNLNDSDEFELYLCSLYWALTTVTSVGYGDSLVGTNLEKAIAMFVTILGVLLWSFASSFIFIALSRIMDSDVIINENLNFAGEFCKEARIPKYIEKRFQICIKEKKITIKKISIDKIIDPHDMGLRYLVAMDMHNQAFTKINFFADKKESFVAHFAFHLVMMQYQSEELIWTKGSYADGIYFICDGRVKLFYKGTMFHFINEGSCVGDLEIFMKCERQFDAQSGDITKCMKLNRDRLKELREDYPDYFLELKENCEDQMKKMLDGISLMISLKLSRSKEIPAGDKSVCEDIKKKIYSEMFSGSLNAVRKKKFLNIIQLNKEFSVYKKRVKNIIRLAANMHNFKL